MTYYIAAVGMGWILCGTGWCGEAVNPLAVDLPGPDGGMMPNFTFAGISGGIPEVPVVARVEDFGAQANDGLGDNDAIEAALRHVEKSGGGAVLFGEGVYDLSRPIVVTSDETVLRGQGMEQTRLRFAYDLPVGGMKIIRPQEGARVTQGDFLEAHINTTRMKSFAFYVGDREISRLGPDYSTGGDRFWMKELVRQHLDKITNGPATLRLVVSYWDGTVQETSVNVVFDVDDPPGPGSIRDLDDVASIEFVGDRWTHWRGRYQLTEDALRGSLRLQVDRDCAFEPGDLFILSTPPSPAFIQSIQSGRPDISRMQMLTVKQVEGNRIHLNQPVRIDFLASEGTTVTGRRPIRRSGVEDLTLEHTEKQWIDGITFATSLECWVKGVRVKAVGRNPLKVFDGKNFQAEDSEFIEARFLAGGGTGYVGFSRNWDSLFQRIHCSGLRHAPVVQWSAGGNVMRNSSFESSDINYHMMWPYENLIEQCTIDAKMGTGSYGYGLFAQKPEFAIHGPGGGPRSIIWNNQFQSPKSGVYLGGSNEGWVFAYNHFEVESGPGMILRKKVTDTVIYRNSFMLKESANPVISFETEDCEHVRIVENNSNAEVLFKGPSTPVDSKNNLGLSQVNAIQPTEPSLYEWQMRLVGKPLKE
jgi:hypothetical protein